MSNSNYKKTIPLSLEEYELCQNSISSELKKLEKSNTESIISYLANLTFDTPKDALTFLFNLSKDEYISNKFIDELMKSPKDTNNIIDILINLVQGEDAKYLLELWLNDERLGYKYAFARYLDKHWEEASDLESLIKISPNIAPWALSKKAHDLKIDYITLGDIPKEFVDSVSEYRKLVLNILSPKNYKFYIPNKYVQYKSLTFKIIQKFMNINDKCYDKTFYIKNYKITPIIKEFSPKRIFKIEVNNVTYILKTNPYVITKGLKWETNKKILENNYIRADMPYSISLIDFYLKFNDSSNVADILFYDHFTNSVLYKASEEGESRFELTESFMHNLLLARNHPSFQELQQLGIFLNDVYPYNFIITKENKLVLIDAGHSYYNHPFRPMNWRYNYSFGNLSGHEQLKLQ